MAMLNFGNASRWLTCEPGVLECFVLARALINDPTSLSENAEMMRDELQELMEECRRRRVTLLNFIDIADEMVFLIREQSGKRKIEAREARKMLSDDCWGYIMESRDALPVVYFKELAPLVNHLMKTLRDPRRIDFEEDIATNT